MNDEPLVYMYSVGKRKPYDYDYANRQSNTQNPCPFCNPQTLTDIYETDGDKIWLHNKYPTLKDTMQTILIESSDHQGDISTYTREENRELMKFGLKCFQKMYNSGDYQSVLWYKNFDQNLMVHCNILTCKLWDLIKWMAIKIYKKIILLALKLVKVGTLK